MLISPRITAVALACSLVGCAQLPRPAKSPEVPPLNSIEVDTNSALGVAKGGGADNSAEINTAFGEIFINRTLRQSDPLPDKAISNLSFNDASVIDALRLLLAGTNISLSFSNASNNNQSVYGSVVSYGLSGTLTEVLESISKSAGFYYSYKDGVLKISPDEQFIVNLPPIVGEDTFAGISNMITKLGGFDVYLDRQGRSLVFRANRAAEESIENYLNYVRETRHLIVYDTYIYQVELADSRQTGIDWTNLMLGGSLNGNPFSITAKGIGGGATSAGIGFNAVYDSKDLSIKALLSFLQSQGNVKTIAQPKLAILSGAKGSFKVGSETNYVSKVGTNTTGATFNQTTVETAKVLSGLNIGIFGDVHDGTVYTNVTMSLTDLLRFNSFQALGTELNLPQTANRELSTIVRARAGDMVLLAGMNNSRDTNDISGLPGSNNSISVLTKSAKDVTRTELVIVLKPKLISFISQAKKVAAAPVAIPSVAASVSPAKTANESASSSSLSVASSSSSKSSNSSEHNKIAPLTKQEPVQKQVETQSSPLLFAAPSMTVLPPTIAPSTQTIPKVTQTSATASQEPVSTSSKPANFAVVAPAVAITPVVVTPPKVVINPSSTLSSVKEQPEFSSSKAKTVAVPPKESSLRDKSVTYSVTPQKKQESETQSAERIESKTELGTLLQIIAEHKGLTLSTKGLAPSTPIQVQDIPRRALDMAPQSLISMIDNQLPSNVKLSLVSGNIELAYGTAGGAQ